MQRRTTLSNGTTATVNIHGRPKGARRKNLPGGLYYIEHGGNCYVYKSNGELETIVRSPEAAKRYAQEREYRQQSSTIHGDDN